MNRDMNEVRWARLLPQELRQRMEELPVVYLPIGLCEPHGHIAPFGLDTIKADYYCEESARRFGGVVAPTQAYHIHEVGFHKPWLDEVVGEGVQAYLGGMPPAPVCYQLLYQLRAFYNAGFRSVIGVSGHSGGSQNDLRLVAEYVSDAVGIPVDIRCDPEWTEGAYHGDHAGSYEISQLLAIDPELIDLSRVDLAQHPNHGGRLAQGDDAADSTSKLGEEINERILESIGRSVQMMKDDFRDREDTDSKQLTIQETEKLWSRITADPRAWFSDKE